MATLRNRHDRDAAGRSARRQPRRTVPRRRVAGAVPPAARRIAGPLHRAFGFRPLLVGLDLQADRPGRIAARDLFVRGRRHHARRFHREIATCGCRCSSRWTGPKHTGQRRTVAPAFTPSEMVRMSDDIRRRTARNPRRAARGQGVRLGRYRVDRADHADAGDPVRFPVGGSPQADLLVRLGRRYRAGQDRGAAQASGSKHMYECGAYFQNLWNSKVGQGADARSHLDDDPFGRDGARWTRSNSSGT